MIISGQPHIDKWWRWKLPGSKCEARSCSTHTVGGTYLFFVGEVGTTLCMIRLVYLASYKEWDSSWHGCPRYYRNRFLRLVVRDLAGDKLLYPI